MMRDNKGSGPEISKHMACVLNSKAILSGTPLKKLLCLLKLINSQIISALCSGNDVIYEQDLSAGYHSPDPPFPIFVLFFALVGHLHPRIEGE